MDEVTAREIIKVSVRTSVMFQELVTIAQARLPETEVKPLVSQLLDVAGAVSDVEHAVYAENPELNDNHGPNRFRLGQLDEPNWSNGPVYEAAAKVLSQRPRKPDRSAVVPEVAEDQLDHLLLSNVPYSWQRAAALITKIFRKDLNYWSYSTLLYGSGSDEPDELVNRCIGRLESLADDGRIELRGNIYEPLKCQVRRMVKSVGPDISGAPEFGMMDFADPTVLIAATQASIHWLAYAFSSERQFELQQVSSQGRTRLVVTPTATETGKLITRDGDIHWEVSRQEAERSARNLFNLAQSDRAAHQYLDPDKNETGLQIIVSLGEYTKFNVDSA